MSVLIVEDEVVIAMFLEELLEEMGHRPVITTYRMTAALEAAQTADLDFAILDHRISGEASFPVTEVLRARGIPFIISTGSELDDLHHQDRNEPILFKPYGARELCAAIESLRRR